MSHSLESRLLGMRTHRILKRKKLVSELNKHANTFLKFWWRLKCLKSIFKEPVNFGDVSDEIFDMVRPVDPYKITLRDMIDCGQGGTVVRILIDLNEFWIYENRESLLAEQED